jgi:hypothetical protein
MFKLEKLPTDILCLFNQ